MLTLALLLAAGCGGGGGGGGGSAAIPSGDTSDSLAYTKYRGALGVLRPVLSESVAGFDSFEVDGPSVVVDKSRPGGDFFMMWYEAENLGGVISIGLVTSDEEDFEDLTVTGDPVVEPTDAAAAATGFDWAATDPTVVLDQRAASQPGARYRMWFEGRSGVDGATSTIVSCVSADGETWTGFQECTGLTPGGDVSFGDRVADPTVVLDRDPGGDLYRMWFEAVDESGDGSARIGYADSPDGLNWIVRDAAGANGAGAGPVISPGFGGAFTAYTVGSPSVVLVEDAATDANIAFHLWYTGGDVVPSAGTEDSIGYAASTNGRSWIPENAVSPLGLPVLRPSSDSLVDPDTGGFVWDSGDIRQPAAWIDTDLAPTTEGAFLLWYAGDIENGGPAAVNRIGFASGRIP